MLGLIGGNGKWGQNYQKVLNKLNIPFIIGTRYNWKNIDIDAAIITTPPESHIEVANYFNNIPLLIEKPLSLNSDFNLLNKNILINNIHLFSQAFETILSLSIKDIVYIKSKGTGDGPFRDYSDFFDYAPHDLSMGMFLTKEKPKLIDYKKNKNHFLTVFYGDVLHEMEVGNQSFKQRYFEVQTPSDIFIYDDLKTDKLTINNKPIKLLDISSLENIVKKFVHQEKDDRWGFELSKDIIKFLELIKKET